MASTIIHLSKKKTLQRLSEFVPWLIGLVVACPLLVSALAHLQNPYRFLDAIYNYQLVPRTVAELLAEFLPFLHLTIALCLIAGIARAAAFGVGSVLFLTYTCAQLAVLMRRMTVDCGCWGPTATARPVGASSVSLALGAFVVCFLGWWLTPRTDALSPQVAGSASR